MSPGKKKILVVSHDLSLTGAPRWLINVVRPLRDRYDFHLLSAEDGPLRAEFAAMGIDVTVDIKILYEVPSTLSRLIDCDAVLVNTLLCHASVLAAAMAGKPSLWSLHEVEGWKWLFDKCQPSSAAAMCVTTTLVAACKFAANIYSSWQPRQAAIVYYGFDSASFPSPRPRPDGPVRVLLAGTIHPRKGQDVALKAMRLLGDRGAQLDIIGAVTDIAFCRQLLDESHGFDSVRWIGELSAAATLDAIGDSDIVIVPSRDDVTPMVISEGMCMGKAVIASNVGGIPEMIQHGETGMLFNSEDSDELARLIDVLASDHVLRKKLGENGREFILNHRSMDGFSRQVGDLIEETFNRFEA